MYVNPGDNIRHILSFSKSLLLGMKNAVAVYESHEQAVQALQELCAADFPLKKVSLVGRAEVLEDHIQLKSTEPAKNAPLIAGATLGPILGLLTGIGIFAIPGVGFLYGAGAIVGVMGGLDLGVVAGGILTLLATLGISKQHHLKFEEHIRTGKFLLIVEGNTKEIEQAKEILHTEANHLELV
jgi:hypothetical protein